MPQLIISQRNEAIAEGSALKNMIVNVKTDFLGQTA
jgi:hypothetical protein